MPQTPTDLRGLAGRVVGLLRAEAVDDRQVGLLVPLVIEEWFRQTGMSELGALKATREIFTRMCEPPKGTV